MRGSRSKRDGFEPCASSRNARPSLGGLRDPELSLLLRFAREQGANAAQAETIIWRAVRDRRCEGAKFRRQVTLGEFIVDFVCFDRRLIIEVDGPTHESAEQQAKDHERDA